jgi:hypothetical protein
MYPVTAVTNLQKSERIIEHTIFVNALIGHRIRGANLPDGERVQNTWAWVQVMSVKFYLPRFGFHMVSRHYNVEQGCKCPVVQSKMRVIVIFLFLSQTVLLIVPVTLQPH